MLYTYLGYGIIIFMISLLKRIFKSGKLKYNEDYQPEVTLFIAAYNEKDFIDSKIQNSFLLDYPSSKLHFLCVTDGSDDGTPEILKKYKNVQVLHEAERNGKIGAINRGMKYVNTPIVVFSDCNTILPANAIRDIVQQFSIPNVGCVAGEKRITNNKKDGAVNAGEGFYWKYESLLKRLESHVYSAMGAVGELFAIRKELFRNVEKDTLLDDFMISMRIALQGYKISYTPHAYAIENASINAKEELKRKVRISAGGIQSMLRLKPLFNIFKYPVLGFQFISHKVLRWTLVPLAFPIIFFINLYLIFKMPVFSLYHYIFTAQILFYIFVFLGKTLGNHKIGSKLIFIPYYIFFMNYAV
ncbi:MAG: glycosyltransferase family 2 protein, partial [Bacteroidota bacterium]